MDSAWLVDFLTLAETGSFSRAAEQRNLTQPAFSRRIRALEDWAGVPLFDRSIIPVALTQSGRQFLPEASRLVDGMALARRVARDAARTGPAVLRLATTDTLAQGFAPALLSQVEYEVPGAAVSVSVGAPRDNEAMLLRGECQLVLAHHHEAAPGLPDGDAVAQSTIAHDAFVPVGCPAIVDAIGEHGEVPLLAYEEDSTGGRLFRSVMGRRLHNIRMSPVFLSHSATLLHAMALRGRGLAWLPLSLVRDDLLAGRVKAVETPSWRERLDVVLLRVRGSDHDALDAFCRQAAAIGGRLLAMPAGHRSA